MKSDVIIYLIQARIRQGIIDISLVGFKLGFYQFRLFHFYRDGETWELSFLNGFIFGWYAYTGIFVKLFCIDINNMGLKYDPDWIELVLG